MSQVVQEMSQVVQESRSCVSVAHFPQPASASTVVGALCPRNGPLELGVTQQVQQQPPQTQTQSSSSSSSHQPQPQMLQLRQQQQQQHQAWSQEDKVPPQPQRPQKPEPQSEQLPSRFCGISSRATIAGSTRGRHRHPWSRGLISRGAQGPRHPWSRGLISRDAQGPRSRCHHQGCCAYCQISSEKGSLGAWLSGLSPRKPERRPPPMGNAARTCFR